MGRIRSTTQPDKAPVYAIAPEITSVLSNWGRWAAVRVGRASTSPLGRIALRGARWDSAAPTSSSSPTDNEQAWLAERTICGPMFSPRFRALLTEHYVLARPTWLTCDSLHIARAGWDHEHWRAALHFWQRFKAHTAAEGVDNDIQACS